MTPPAPARGVAGLTGISRSVGQRSSRAATGSRRWTSVAVPVGGSLLRQRLRGPSLAHSDFSRARLRSSAAQPEADASDELRKPHTQLSWGGGRDVTHLL